MKKKTLVTGFVVSCLIVFSACKKESTTIVPAMQKATEKLFRTEMELSKLDSVLVMLVSTKTGEMLTCVKLVNDPVKKHIVSLPFEQMDIPAEPGYILAPINVMKMLDVRSSSLDEALFMNSNETILNGKVLVDPKIKGQKGSMLRLGDLLMKESIIGVSLVMDETFKGNPALFYDGLDSMLNGTPSDKKYLSTIPETEDKLISIGIGEKIQLKPTQILTLWNGLANNGTVVKPVFNAADIATLNPSMSATKSMDAMKAALIKNTAVECPNIHDLVMFKKVDQIADNAALKGTFVGYYPEKDPQKTCLIMLYKTPSSDENKKEAIKDLSKLGKELFVTLSTMK